eukprot:SAG31_NODE_9_length_42330_cov_441.979162_14_plen_855_part_00
MPRGPAKREPDDESLCSDSDSASEDSDENFGWSCFPYVEKCQLSGHKDRVCAIAFSPNGERVATADDASLVHLWDAESGRRTAILRGHQGPASTTAFSIDGSIIASSTRRGSAFKLWDSSCEHRAETVNGHMGSVNALCFSPCGRRLATASSDSTAILWDLRARILSKSTRGNLILQHRAAVLTVAFRPNGRWTATGCAATNDGCLFLWDSYSGIRLQTLQSHRPRCDMVRVEFSLDGQSLVTAGGKAAVWTVGSSRQQDANRSQLSTASLLELWEVAPASVEEVVGNAMLLQWKQLIDRTVDGQTFSCNCHHSISFGHGSGLSLIIAARALETRKVLLMSLSFPSRSSQRGPAELRANAQLPIRGGEFGPENFTAVAFSPNGCELAIANDNTLIRRAKSSLKQRDKNNSVSIWDLTVANKHHQQVGSKVCVPSAVQIGTGLMLEGRLSEDNSNIRLREECDAVSSVDFEHTPRKITSLNQKRVAWKDLIDPKVSAVSPDSTHSKVVSAISPDSTQSTVASRDLWTQLDKLGKEHDGIFNKQMTLIKRAAATVTRLRQCRQHERQHQISKLKCRSDGVHQARYAQPAWNCSTRIDPVAPWCGPAPAAYKPSYCHHAGAAVLHHGPSNDNLSGWWDGHEQARFILEKAFGSPDEFSSEVVSLQRQIEALDCHLAAAKVAGQRWVDALHAEKNGATASVAAVRVQKEETLAELHEAEALQSDLYGRLLAAEDALEDTRRQLDESVGNCRRMAALHSAEVGALRRQLAHLATQPKDRMQSDSTLHAAKPELGHRQNRVQCKRTEVQLESQLSQLIAAIDLLGDLRGDLRSVHALDHNGAVGRITTVIEMLERVLEDC